MNYEFCGFKIIFGECVYSSKFIIMTFLDLFFG